MLPLRNFKRLGVAAALSVVAGAAGCHHDAHTQDQKPKEAIARNFREMLADGRDLNAMQKEKPRLAARRDTVMEAYASGRKTGADRDSAEKVQVSPIGGTR